MNKAYTTWKNNYEAEFEEHRKANFRIVYRYQSEYEYYSNSPEWGMIGDFCNFYRIGTLHIGEQITAKYEKLMLDDINIFEGWCLDEFERIRVWNSFSFNDNFTSFLDEAKKIFEYTNMKVRYEDLTTNQKWSFKKMLKQHLDDNREVIEMLKGYHNNS